MDRKQNVLLLRNLIEKSMDKKMETAGDFLDLFIAIEDRLNETLSLSTLKRIWGYIDGYDTVRFHTLSILARFVGYSDWDDFVNCNNENLNEQSEEILQKCIHSRNLKVGEKVYFTWNPDRECISEFLGNDTYKILDCRNTKLQKNSTFLCSFFVEGQSLYLDDLTVDGQVFAMFVAGKNGGLKIVEKTEREVL